MLQLALTLLLLSSSLAADPTNTTDFWKTQLGVKPDFHSYAGYEDIDKYYKVDTTGMYYHLFGSYGVDLKVNSPDHPIFIWLERGPGESSQLSAFTQQGPIRIKDGKAVENTWSWLTFGHLLFVDSVLNGGFSYSNETRNGTVQVSSTDEAVNHVINFLDKFFRRWTSLTENKIYLVGESFGGHYVPVLGRELLKNSAYASRIAGILIGGGWTDPITQLNYYDSYLWSVGVIDRSARETCTWFQTQSMLNIDRKRYHNATEYIDFLIDNTTTHSHLMGNISINNFRKYTHYDHSYITFLQNNKQALGATVDFIHQNQQIHNAFTKDITTTVVEDVVTCLQKTKVLIFNGQNDVVVNTPGVIHYVTSINWNQIHQWKKTKKQIYKISNDNAGWAKVHNNLWFVLLNQAGHFAVADQPVRSFHMVGKFVSNENHWEI